MGEEVLDPLRGRDVWGFFDRDREVGSEGVGYDDGVDRVDGGVFGGGERGEFRLGAACASAC